jgi:hypothetical protein
MADNSINNHAAFIWSVADLLRGDYKQSEYGRVSTPSPGNSTYFWIVTNRKARHHPVYDTKVSEQAFYWRFLDGTRAIGDETLRNLIIKRRWKSPR